MSNIETVFGINKILMTLFSSLENIRERENVELIYDMEASIPKELRGDSTLLLGLLMRVLNFVFEESDNKEIVLHLTAPKDFLYEESISFSIDNLGIDKDKIKTFLDTKISDNINALQGEIDYTNSTDINFLIPFKIKELGFRRHYRLPNISMLGKKVLLIANSQKLMHSIKKMFKYFLYEVDIGVEDFIKQGNNLFKYDFILIEDRLITNNFEKIIMDAQDRISFGYVILENDDYVIEINSSLIVNFLSKPVTQESIFELIIKIFENDIHHTDIEEKYFIDMKELLDESDKIINNTPLAFNNSNKGALHTIIQEKEKIKLSTLNIELGKENTQKMNLNYAKELKHFLDTFDRSDRYLRQIVNEKATNKIKDFAIDLEKQAKIIGAESIWQLSDIISLIFVYNKLDLLEIYPGKYHIELKKVTIEIKKYLKIK